MSNPVVVSCPNNVWVKIATAVTSGVVHKLVRYPAKYVQTYRLTGEAAPTDDTDAGAVFENSSQSAAIGHNEPIDVYVKAITGDGKVRVDI